MIMSDKKSYLEELSDTVSRLSHQDNLRNMCHICRDGEPLPSQEAVSQIIKLSRSIIFPGFFGDSNINQHNIVHHIGLWCEQLYTILVDQITAGIFINTPCDEKISLSQIKEKANECALLFIKQLPQIRHTLYTDVIATYNGDPAAESIDEVIYCYPAIRAISNYRIAHSLIKLGVPIIPRMISEQAHRDTGIDIHPAATIGESFTIDHGTGVVIGATAIIGNNVKLYQGVTLGAKSFDTDENNNPIKGIPRHPIIGDNVIIYSNASILGRITIGKNAVIGGNIWVTEDIAEGEKLVQAKANNILRFKQ